MINFKTKQCLGIIYQADVRCRQEHTFMLHMKSEDMLEQSGYEHSLNIQVGNMCIVWFDAGQPWEWVVIAAVNNVKLGRGMISTLSIMIWSSLISVQSAVDIDAHIKGNHMKLGHHNSGVGPDKKG